jgi:alpha-L-fucosidase
MKSLAIAPYGATPTARQKLWQSTELYGFIHFGPNTFTNKEWGFGDESPEIFQPTAFDPEQWVRVAKEAGLRGLVLVCKHHDGFCLWPTASTEHCVRNSPWRAGQGDVVAEVSAACRKHGLKFGVYVSPWDRNHPGFGSPSYVEVFHQQVEEVLTNYGPLFEVWFDGAIGDDGYFGGAREVRKVDVATYYQWEKVEKLVRRLQPEACIFGLRDIRWVGNETGIAAETCWATSTSLGNADPAPPAFNGGNIGSGNVGDRHGPWLPAECDFPLRKGWFFHPEDDIRSPEALYHLYFTSIGRGTTMSIGLAPDTRGLIHEDDVKTLLAWKALLDETFGEDFLRRPGVEVSTSHPSLSFPPGHLLDGNPSTFWTGEADGTKPELVFTLPGEADFNVLLIEEAIDYGQRIDAFAVDAWMNGEWREIGRATSIGYRRLLVLENARTTRLRLRFEQVTAFPVIRRVGLFAMPAWLILGGALQIIRDNAGRAVIRSSHTGLCIRYTTDGSDPGPASPLYDGPFLFPGSGTIKAFGHLHGRPTDRTGTASATFGISRRDWRVVSVSLDSPFKNQGTAGVEKLLDDDPETYWHTYHKDKSLSAPPHEVVFDMGRTVRVRAFTFQPRLNAADGIPEGIPDKFAFYLSPDGKNWTLAVEGEFSNIKANPVMQLVPLQATVAGRYLRFVARHVIDDGDYVIVSGLGVVEDSA